jgi:tetraacyldisaccharide 4'-kinase
MLMQAWSRRGVAACALWPLSLLFRLLSALRRAGYRTGLSKATRVRVPVIVVGNIFIGGTGKTPLTIWLVRALRQAGFQPGVISRGYGAAGEAPRAVTSASLPAEVGDEPVLIADACQAPVVVGRRRVDAAQALLAQFPEVDVIVSDDGLQHYALARDIEIMLFDARGTGNGWMLPAGPLREPASRRSDFVVVNASSMPPGIGRDAILMRLQGEQAYRLADPAHTMPLAAVGGVGGRRDGPPRIVAAAGIGNPARFFAMLEGAGLRFERLPLPDHYDFAVNPFASIDADVILITEKDAVKCRRIDNINNDPRVWVVPVTAHIDHALAERIVEKLRGHPTA